MDLNKSRFTPAPGDCTCKCLNQIASGLSDANRGITTVSTIRSKVDHHQLNDSEYTIVQLITALS